MFPLLLNKKKDTGYSAGGSVPDNALVDDDESVLVDDDGEILLESELGTLQTINSLGNNETSNPVILLGDSLESDYRIREIGNILYEPGEGSRVYKFFYTGYRDGIATDEKIHYAYSEDSIVWSKSSANPVISNRRTEDPYVVRDGSTYYLYAEDKEAGGVGEADSIRRWHSTDCETWVDDGQITGLGDAQSPVVWIEGATWYLLYEQYPDTPKDIRLATSSDGLAWIPDGSNPVITNAEVSFGSDSIVPDDIVKINSNYYLFFHGSDGDGINDVGMATSTNLTAWTMHPNNTITSDDLVKPPVHTQIIEKGDGRFAFLYYTEDDVGVYRGNPISPT